MWCDEVVNGILRHHLNCLSISRSYVTLNKAAFLLEINEVVQVYVSMLSLWFLLYAGVVAATASAFCHTPIISCGSAITAVSTFIHATRKKPAKYSSTCSWTAGCYAPKPGNRKWLTTIGFCWEPAVIRNWRELAADQWPGFREQPATGQGSFAFSTAYFEFCQSGTAVFGAAFAASATAFDAKSWN